MKKYEPKGICKKMGQICGMTTIDVEQINLLYKCKNIKPKACQDMATGDYCRTNIDWCELSESPGRALSRETLREFQGYECKKTCDMCHLS